MASVQPGGPSASDYRAVADAIPKCKTNDEGYDMKRDRYDTRRLEHIRRKGLRRDIFAAEIIGPVLMKGDNLTAEEAVEQTYHLANLMLEKSAKLMAAEAQAIEDANEEFERAYAISPIRGTPSGHK